MGRVTRTVGFLYKSTTILPFLILHYVSRNARDSLGWKLQGGGGFSILAKGEWQDFSGKMGDYIHLK